MMKQEIVRLDLGGVNSYLCRSEEGFILVDTGGCIITDGEFCNRREALDRQLENAGCRPGDLGLVILTHGDNDHAANASFIRDRYRTKIAMHQADLDLVESFDTGKFMESFNYRSPYLKNYFQEMKDKIEQAAVKIVDAFEKFSPDLLVDEGFDLSEFGFEAKILHIPGHTRGSIGILAANGDFIAGDTFVNMEKPDTAANAYDFDMLDDSGARLRNMGLNTVYPGHGSPFEARQSEI